MPENQNFNTPLEQLTTKARGDVKLNLADLAGTWKACDQNTRGLVRVVLRASGGNLKVRVFGACHPTPCDWGTVNGLAYAESVSATDAIAFSAVYTPGFKETIVTGRLDNGTLIVETYNHFTDGSGRSNYYSRGYFCKLQRKDKE